MPSIARRLVPLCAAALALIAPAQAATDPAQRLVAPTQAATDPAQGLIAPAQTATDPAITVRGSQLFRDGAPWVPRGVQIVGLVAPDSALSGKYVAAHAHFGAAELQAAVADHADLVRFQVSQFGIDPDSPLYSPPYVREVQGGVAVARSLGLAVIVSLQAEPPAGEPTRCPLPDAGAENAWKRLAAMFAGDPGVMFELYNEPAIAPTPGDWALWRDGGEVLGPNGQCQAVGMQDLVDDIRALAPGNVIILPGLAGEQTLAGMPPITDPADPRNPQLAYGIHYPSLTRGSGAWDRAFGELSGRVPVLVTEWDASSTTNCIPDSPAEAQLLLDYLASKRIGVVGFAFDLPGTIVTDWSGTPSTYAGFACGQANGGPGQILFGDYAAEAAAGDGSTLVASPAWMLSASTVSRLDRLAPATAGRFFDTPRTFVTGASAASLAALGAPAAVPTESFPDADRLTAAIDNGTLRPGTRAIVYAPSHSRATPAAQQRNPVRYARLAAQAAHAHGLLFVAAPALNLVAVLRPGTPTADEAAQFLKLRIAAGAARDADAVEVPAAIVQQSPAAFGGFTAAAAAQAAAAHPGVEVLAGLSAGPAAATGGGPTADALFDAFLRTPAAVSGYGLSEPAGSAGGADTGTGTCAACAGDAGLAFLRRVARLQDALPAEPATG